MCRGCVAKIEAASAKVRSRYRFAIVCPSLTRSSGDTKYLNNIIEQDHRVIKRLVKPGMGFGVFNTARRTIRGYGIINMMRKGQLKEVAKGVVTNRVKFIHQIFEVAA